MLHKEVYMKTNYFSKAISGILAAAISSLPHGFFSSVGDKTISLRENIFNSIMCVAVSDETDPGAYGVDITDELGKALLLSTFPKTENITEGVISEQQPLLQNPALTDTEPYLSDEAVLGGQYHSGKPLVAIYHTHTTESYMIDEDTTIYRNDDKTMNMVMVGTIISKVLNSEFGIEVLHITDTFDKPYSGAYNRSRTALEGAMEAYPTIKYAFDIHRDGLSVSESNRKVYLTSVQEAECAKVMLVIGNKSVSAAHNIEFAGDVADKMNALYPGLYKSIFYRDHAYNQNIAENSLLFEVGSNLSTLTEAKTTAVFIGRVLGKLILEDMNGSM